MAVVNPDWMALRQAIKGKVFVPDDSEYDEARVLILRQYDDIRPRAVVRCATVDDVAEAVRFGREFGLRCAVRSGGHSFAGYSAGTGMVIDLSGMSRVEVDGGTVRAQAGTQLVDLYDTTLRHGLAVPSGWCPTVAVGGLALGGGVGLETRKHGLTVDHVLSITVVLADGRIVVCDSRTEPDLFWAMRGGGGGNFGVAVDFAFRPVEVTDVIDYKMRWPWSIAVPVLDAWQRWAPDAPDDLASVVNIGAMDAGDAADPEIVIAGVWHGDPLEMNPLLQRLVDAVGAEPEMSCVSLRTYRDAIMHWFDCGDFTTEEAHIVGHNPAAKIERYAFSLARGGFFDGIVPVDGLAELVAAVTEDGFPGTRRDFNLIAFGGACNRVTPDSTAFVHRNNRFYAGYSVDMHPVATPEGAQAGREWIDASWEVLQRWSTGHSYQNFMDPSLADYQRSYYGANHSRLTQIRDRYDPERFFDFPQAI